MRQLKLARWLSLALILPVLFFNCHAPTDQSAAVQSENRTPDSIDQTVHAMPNEVTADSTSDDGAPVGDPKVRLTTAVLANSASGGSAKLSADSRLPAGTSLLALYDNECRGKSSLLRYEAVALELNDSKSIAALEAEAGSDRCLLRIDENHFRTFIDPIENQAATTDSGSVESNSNRIEAAAVVVNDPRIGEARQLGFTKAIASWDWFYSSLGISQDVLVAAIDTGSLYTHPDLVDSIYTDADGQHGYDFVNADSDPLDDNGHGTHVSGIIAARTGNGIGISGIAGPRVKLMAIKVLNREGAGEDADIANGIRYAADRGALVINMSLGGQFASPPIRDAMVYAVGKGTVIITAAGNSNEAITATNFYAPAGYAKDIPGCLAIGAVDAVSGNRPEFSNFGPQDVWLAAPGSNGILSTYLANGYMALQGTSMASPVAAGAAALIVGAFRGRGISYTPAQVTEILTESARPVSTLTSVFRNGATLDIERAARLFYSRYVMAGDAGTEAP